MKLNQSHEIQKDVGKVAGEWYCPRCFIQNNVREDRCTGCAEEKNDFYIVQTLSTSQKSKLKAKQNNQKALAKIANRNPEANVISHVCEWDWIYCDGIICQDPNYNRSIDIMEDLVENEYDEKVKCDHTIIVALPFDEEVLNQSLILVGLFPQTFRREDDGDLSRSQPSTPRVKRQKKKEIGLKHINNLLQRREDNKEKERLNGEKEPETIKKKPKTTNLRPKLRLYGPTDIPETSEDPDDEIFSFGSTSDEEQTPEQTPVIIHTPEVVDHDLNVALSLQFDSEHVAHKLSKSTEIKNTTAWPTLQPQGTIAPPSSPAAWPSLSPAASPQPKPASPWGSKPTAWGNQSLAQKLQALKTEK